MVFEISIPLTLGEFLSIKCTPNIDKLQIEEIEEIIHFNEVVHAEKLRM